MCSSKLLQKCRNKTNPISTNMYNAIAVIQEKVYTMTDDVKSSKTHSCERVLQSLHPRRPVRFHVSSRMLACDFATLVERNAQGYRPRRWHANPLRRCRRRRQTSRFLPRKSPCH